MLTLGCNCKCAREQEALPNRKKIEFSSYQYFITTTTTGITKSKATSDCYCYNSINAMNYRLLSVCKEEDYGISFANSGNNIMATADSTVFCFGFASMKGGCEIK